MWRPYGATIDFAITLQHSIEAIDETMVEVIDTKALIIGAGIVGLSTALCLTKRRVQTIVVERNDSFGLETSSRSSEVLHHGLYYTPGSLKARLCREGALDLTERCQRLGIPMLVRGKLVIAQELAQEAALVALRDNALACGARDLEIWGADTLRRREPRVRATLALYSPHTSVVDSYELMRSFAVEAKESGALFAYRHRVLGLAHDGDTWRVDVTTTDAERLEIRAEIVVNAAGLDADVIAESAGVDLDEAGHRVHFCKGDYFSLSGQRSRRLERLIYPLPDASLEGLGVHLTLDVAGQARLGPDTTWLTRPLGETPYRVDEGKRAAFLEAGRRILPDLAFADLSPDRCGIRPKLSGPGEPARDFLIRHETARGLPGLINLIGIESPGLTASPAIGREVLRILERDGLI